MEKLIVKPINDLLKETFFIPSYQRGYRWTQDQVKNLLEDIWKFREDSEDESKDVFYCLQPVVVSKKERGWELIDGQQRLTTISIILTCLKKQLDALDKTKFLIDYETRPGSINFLNELGQISLAQRNENVDYYHICEAYDTVMSWFEGRDGNDKLHFLTTLLNDEKSGKNVKVIWYDVTDENTSEKYAVDIFTRLNIGKIPLTNAELVKALFLSKVNFEDQASLHQIQIATEWDAIEKRLQTESFWYFIYSPKNSIQYENRIEYIFDLVQSKGKNTDEQFTFNQFVNQFPKRDDENRQQKIEKLWLGVKQYFLTLEAWYNNRDLYHLIGFLIECEADIDDLKKKSATMSKSEFLLELKRLIKYEFRKTNIYVIKFDRNKSDIRKVLLFFNVQSILSNQEGDMRFPFHKYKMEKWDIVHINSQTEKQIDLRQSKIWALDLLEFITRINGFSIESDGSERGITTAEAQKSLVEQMEDNDILKPLANKLIFILENDKIDFDYYENVILEARKIFKEGEIAEPNDISNLALLDSSTNRSYGNAMFPVKRKRIIENDMNGLFVPLCTKNVFLKYYSKQMKDVMYWQQQDAADYLQAITNTLKEYLPLN